MSLPAPPKDDILPVFGYVMLAVIVVLFAVHNLPWHLDNLDQAKQAYTSHQMIDEGKWLFQETPTGRVATKPPLQGWISSVLYLGVGGHGWELAWRIPAFVAALLILRQLWRTGEALYGNNIGAVLAAGTFGLNLFVPRLATLVRTDMLLTAFIFFTGWVILEKLRTDTLWTMQDRVVVGVLMLGSMLTKGPIAFAFLLPGLIAYLLLSRRFHMSGSAWPGWLVWLIPLAIFGVWVWQGCETVPGFKEQVIDKEFLGRFTVGKAAKHHNQIFGYYVLNLISHTLPWSILLIVLFCQKSVRAALRQDNVLLWLTCWTVGGLLCMECVPSKRFDRILPVLPPMCLLLAAAMRHLHKHWLWRLSSIHLAILAAILALPMAVGYSGWEIFKGVRDDTRALVRFGEEVQEKTAAGRDRLAVVNGKDEGMVLYAGVHQFTRMDDARAMWKVGRIDWMVLGSDDFDENAVALEPFEVLTRTPKVPEKENSYRLLRRLTPPTAKPHR
jgi:4-amino-4-deoxy-L-arabinose transferase-like glycosyltransferase